MDPQQNQDIPREQWGPFLETFGREHRGWLFSLDVLGQNTHAAVEVRDLPLVDLEIDLSPYGPNRIAVTLGEGPNAVLTHTVASPIRVRLSRTEPNGRETLEIDSKDGSRTLLRFRGTVLPEMLDGVSKEELVGG
jgi:uncharacterized protein DUF5335